ncbi:hypothetical protein BOTBODRAFT_39603 [Botryobasidium botryosum FD-172 SS1]|uniref:Uncharacterized protein n=1 Tax=Botryobasidium botryosum (strain FD-172 SS1) TaxID=930990 RepID=A0A067M4F2_BOTB1|nr:hypothetical protein BOTBODRAFT_39707 [Botryobasidium botryosum FD-172 SS1]KDQ06451.1 hypothetical protein BOTBODRAFT_39603 [Botryobasidium botryosum FD-172 SS1]
MHRDDRHLFTWSALPCVLSSFSIFHFAIAMGNLPSSCSKSSTVPTPVPTPAPTPTPTHAPTPAPPTSQTQNDVSAESSEKIDYRILDAAAFVAASNSVFEEIGTAFARVQYNMYLSSRHTSLDRISCACP